MYSAEINEESSKQILNQRKYYMLPPFWVLVVGVFAIIIAILGVMLGGIGIFREKQTNGHALSTNYVESQCFVYFIESIEHPCLDMICYDQKFKVSYFLLNGSEIISSISMKNLREKSPINLGETHRCVYNRFDPIASIQWNPFVSSSSSQTVFIAVGLTLIIIAVILILITISSMIFHGGIRFKHLQRRNQMLQHLSEDHY